MGWRVGVVCVKRVACGHLVLLLLKGLLHIRAVCDPPPPFRHAAAVFDYGNERVGFAQAA